MSMCGLRRGDSCTLGCVVDNGDEDEDEDDDDEEGMTLAEEREDGGVGVVVVVGVVLSGVAANVAGDDCWLVTGESELNSAFSVAVDLLANDFNRLIVA
jgi:hypothetical protein